MPCQGRPYPPLVDVVKNQPIFEFEDISGTPLGFRLPDYDDALTCSGPMTAGDVAGDIKTAET